MEYLADRKDWLLPHRVDSVVLFHIRNARRFLAAVMAFLLRDDRIFYFRDHLCARNVETQSMGFVRLGNTIVALQPVCRKSTVTVVPRWRVVPNCDRHWLLDPRYDEDA